MSQVEDSTKDKTSSLDCNELMKAGIQVPESKKFESLKGMVSDKTLNAIKNMGFEEMTEIQYRTIVPLLANHDLLGAAKTGSGKTLAFLIPAIEALRKRKFKPKDGAGVIIISPTRELALQIFGVLRDLMKNHTQTFGLIMGGADRNQESYKLGKGVNILIATPGRLLDHLQTTKAFKTTELFMLIIDEADRILQIGFETEMNEILGILPKRRQTLMFSATITENIQNLANLCLNSKPIYIGVDDDKTAPTVDTLKQGFILTPPEKKLSLLYTFIKKNTGKKIMVFFSSCNSVQFHSDLFNYIDMPVMEIHGKLKQSKRTSTFVKFTTSKSGVLFCTDVAARGLDIPQVDWIVQYDPPDDPNEYIHRVGRTARGNQNGQAVLVLLKEELSLVLFLKERNIPITEFDFAKAKIFDIDDQIFELIEKNYHLNTSAKLAFKSYLQSYSSHSNKDIFDVNRLDIGKVCRSFGFETPPGVNLGIIHLYRFFC
ncbi:putative ATP-dependent RNA helicase pitchoune [Thelohanellus kitauei]|uniref:ATP-dependent RNA helicase n=1 Tax=Thelohanellus kitauei TaxID=669202 RepID=A0A0C2JGB2_THEKT|nr:putative ATP-dependent RNA helicase pitchoune [Thelohanellus kitauei]